MVDNKKNLIQIFLEIDELSSTLLDTNEETKTYNEVSWDQASLVLTCAWLKNKWKQPWIKINLWNPIKG